MIRVLCLAVGVLSAMACGSHDDHGGIQTFLWDTAGGGDLHFTVIAASPDFQIVVTGREGKTPNVTIRLTSADGAVYRLVDDILSGRRDIRRDTFEPKGATGTWTSITLVYSDGSRETVKNIDTQGELRQLYSFVQAHLDAA
jgi:hypothetical protein